MTKIRVAILDMYKGEPNQGMRNIHEILDRFGLESGLELEKVSFDVRRLEPLPSLDFDIYISSGGPGSPIDHEGWEQSWLQLVSDIIEHNKHNHNKKFVFLICHSFQLMCYHFQLATVSMRKSESFGIFPMHPTREGKHNHYTGRLPDPFWAVDSRKWQVVNPNKKALKEMGASILAIEKHRPHIPLERATMAIQFTPEILGTQFHPEADAKGMLHYLQSEEKKAVVIKNYGQKKYESMIEHLQDPDKIALTQQNMIPVFLHEACKQLMITHPA